MSVSSSSIQISRKYKIKSSYLWPEWSDSDYNSIRMDLFQKDKPILEKNLYNDPEIFYLPQSLQPKVVNWVRTYDFFKDASQIVLFQECDTYKFPNLHELNEHLMCSSLMRLIISSFGVLQYFGDQYPDKMPKFFFSFQNSNPWRPWFHLYTFGKMKKDAPMDPMWNSNGVCVARLFYGGNYVLIRMDDFIPVDDQGRALLPLLADTDKETNVAILWPLFLTKALLKIAALTWTETEEIVDFNPIHNITGWIFEKIDVRGLDKKQIWDMCRPYAAEYVWPDDNLTEGGKRKSKHKPGKTPTVSTFRTNTLVNVPLDKQMFLCVLLKDINFTDYRLPQLGPCYGHLCYVERTRNCVLEKPEKMPELEPWKKHRWVDWARERQTYPPDPYAESTYSFEILSTFRRSLANGEIHFPANPPPPPSRVTVSSAKSSKKSKHAGPPPIESPLIWCTFDHIVNHIFELHLFFIPSSFQNNWLVTLKTEDRKSKPKSAGIPSVKLDDKKSRKSIVSVGTTASLDNKMEIMSWPNELLISRNSPIYLYIDSSSTKFLLFSLQHKCMKYIKPRPETYIVSTTLHKNSNYRSKASLSIEKYTFESCEFGEVEFFMNTMGVTSRSLTISEGRHVFRLWLKSETPTNFLILSNTHFAIGKEIPILESMTKVPFRLQEYSNNFSNAFSTYYNSIGYDDFKSSMRAFYQLLRPNRTQCSKQTRIITNEKIVDILFDLCELCENPKDVKYALSVLLGPRLSPNLIEEYSVENSAARKIQAIFRGFYVRRVLEKRFIDNKQYDIIQNSLREYYDKFFSVVQRNFLVPKIFLTLLKKTNIYDYDFYIDYKYYLKSYTFNSPQRSKVDANSWAPLLMCKFFVQKSIFLRITMQSELSTQIVRVFNSDTGEELPRFLDNVKPQIFNKNDSGYTIVAYGWNLDTADIWDNAWVLQFSHLITDDLILNVLQCDFKECYKSQMDGIYIPNEANIVCGCFIRIKHTTTVVIRVGTTYELAKIKVKLMTELGTPIYELSGAHAVVFPPILLKQFESENLKSSYKSPNPPPLIETTDDIFEFESLQQQKEESLDTFVPYKNIEDRQQTSQKPNKDTRYYLKVEVLENSWPCTSTEWNAIQEYKHNKEFKPLTVRDSSASSQRSMKKNKSGPLWTVNVMSFDQVTLHQDTERDTRISQLKNGWETANPGRFLLASKLRQQILQEFNIGLKPEEADDPFIKKMSLRRKSSASKSVTKPKVSPSVQTPIIEERTLIPKWKEEKLLNFKHYRSTSDIYNFIKKLLLEKNQHIMTTDNYWIKTREDENYRDLFREYRIQDFKKRYRMMNTFMDYLLDDYSKRFGSVYDHLEENLLISEDLTSEVYDTRKFICEQERSRNMSSNLY